MSPQKSRELILLKHLQEAITENWKRHPEEKCWALNNLNLIKIRIDQIQAAEVDEE